jgi:hypothetical protein
MIFTLNERPLTHCQLRQSIVVFQFQQHCCFSDTCIEILCRKQVCAHRNWQTDAICTTFNRPQSVQYAIGVRTAAHSGIRGVRVK